MSYCHVVAVLKADDILNKLLMSTYGPLVTKDDLRKVLGYATGTALRMAINRKTSPVTIFPLPHRHNKFGLSIEIADWLLGQRIKNCKLPLQLQEDIPKDVVGRYGALLHQTDINELFGFSSEDECKSEMVNGALKLPVFTIDNRQTKLFVLANEVAAFL